MFYSALNCTHFIEELYRELLFLCAAKRSVPSVVKGFNLEIKTKKQIHHRGHRAAGGLHGESQKKGS
jgi:hypothetical protein